MNYVLHPAVTPESAGNLKVADLGTGTAYIPRPGYCNFNARHRLTCKSLSIWLLDLARELPTSVQLDGFDISAAQYPAQEHLPANVHLAVLDSVSTKLPKEMYGQYDIVHLRLFIGVVRDRDPSPLLLNALNMLRKQSCSGFRPFINHYQ